jgi:hypothetical protein
MADNSYQIENKPANKAGYFTPAESNGYYAARYAREGITVHWWGDGTGADNHDNIVNYMNDQSAKGLKSVNFVLSDNKITECVPRDMVAWASQGGNPTTISVETQPTLGAEGYKKWGWLVAKLENQYGRTLNLYPHNKWAQTACPGTIDIARIRAEADKWKRGEYDAPAAPPPPPTPPAVVHPYTVDEVGPIQMIARTSATKWGLTYDNWTAMVKGGISQLSASDGPITITAVAHHALGSDYFMTDATDASGYNAADLIAYVPPADEQSPAPAPTDPQIVFERLPQQTTYKTKLQPTHAYGFNHTKWPEISADVDYSIDQNKEFIAVGRAIHELGGVFLMNAVAFGDADVSGKPAKYSGVNQADLDKVEPVTEAVAIPVTVDPPADPTDAPAPGTTVQPTVPDPKPETKLELAADWRSSFKQSVQPLVVAFDTIVKDIEGVLDDIELKAGTLIAKGGDFWKDGEHFVRTIQSEAADHWYGIDDKVLRPVSKSQLSKAWEIVENIADQYKDQIGDELDRFFREGMKFEDEIEKDLKAVVEKQAEKLKGRDKLVDVAARILFSGKNKKQKNIQE